MSNVVESFYVDGVHTPLSNFYSWRMAVDGFEYDTVEHYFQCMKAASVEDAENIRTATTPGEAKRLGRRCKMRQDWEAIKIPVMRRALLHKFELNNEMGEYLLATGDAWLVEGNTWGDRFWGAVNGVGDNWLGTLLMARRAELRAL
jgi:ribA/ribD-fused uncharacterized protein